MCESKLNMGKCAWQLNFVSGQMRMTMNFVSGQMRMTIELCVWTNAHDNWTLCLDKCAWQLHFISGQMRMTIELYIPVLFLFDRFLWKHRSSHRTGCTGPDPTNFWDSNMRPAQNFVAKFWFTTTWTLYPSSQPRRRSCVKVKPKPTQT